MIIVKKTGILAVASKEQMVIWLVSWKEKAMVYHGFQDKAY